MALSSDIEAVTDVEIQRFLQNRQLLTSLLEALGRPVYGALARIDSDAVRCPFHSDSNPSGHIYCPDHRKRAWMYTCHACEWNLAAKHGASNTGDIIHIARMALAKHRKPADFGDAVRFLRRFRERITTIERSSIVLLHEPPPEPTPDPDEVANARAYMPIAQRALRVTVELQNLLWTTRAVDPETAVRCGVGYSPDEFGGAYWCFPIVDDSDQLQVVKLHAVDSGLPKSFWYPRHAKQGRPLYPVDLRPVGPVLVAGGELKALAVISLGLAAIGMTSGETAPCLTEEMVELLHGRIVMLVPDNDRTGVKWATAMASQLLERQIPSRRVMLGMRGTGADIGDWLVQRRVVDGVSAEVVRAELLQRFAEAQQVGR